MDLVWKRKSVLWGVFAEQRSEGEQFKMEEMICRGTVMEGLKMTRIEKVGLRKK